MPEIIPTKSEKAWFSRFGGDWDDFDTTNTERPQQIHTEQVDHAEETILSAAQLVGEIILRPQLEPEIIS